MVYITSADPPGMFAKSLSGKHLPAIRDEDLFLDPRLQRSKRGTNCARSSEQQDMLALG